MNPYDPPKIRPEKSVDRDMYVYNKKDTDWASAFFIFVWLLIFFFHRPLFDFFFELFKRSLHD
ncbi:MAG: hypothetical protein CL833_01750 [Crocinitomicaceae bacterium]|nr:hypothetical protein [Crocinitomicaceae bacterium]|tara:strand:- start:1710 stop:1898 length:189 start_codon:yes stop_codon:yes gene_type:complete